MEALTALGGIVISIGIDPGAKGAIVAIDGSNDILYAKELPFIGKVLDCAEVFEVLLSLKSNDSDNTFAVLEAVTARPHQGVTSMFTFGRGYGMLEALLIALGISYELSRPSRTGWHKILHGIEGTDPKTRAVLFCRRRLPNLDLTPGRKRKPDSGLADAACMAMWAKKMQH